MVSLFFVHYFTCAHTQTRNIIYLSFIFAGVTVAYSGGFIAGTSTFIPLGVVAPPAQPKFIDFLGVGDQ